MKITLIRKKSGELDDRKCQNENYLLIEEGGVYGSFYTSRRSQGTQNIYVIKWKRTIHILRRYFPLIKNKSENGCIGNRSIQQ